jgi:hypothetical protein
MVDEALEHLRKSVYGTVIIIAVLAATYVLLGVYSIGFTIVALFPVLLVAVVWSLANLSLFVTKRRSSQDPASTVASADTAGSSSGPSSSSGDGDVDPKAVEDQLESILEISRAAAEDTEPPLDDQDGDSS